MDGLTKRLLDAFERGKEVALGAYDDVQGAKQLLLSRRINDPILYFTGSVQEAFAYAPIGYALREQLRRGVDVSIIIWDLEESIEGIRSFLDQLYRVGYSRLTVAYSGTREENIPHFLIGGRAAIREDPHKHVQEDIVGMDAVVSSRRDLTPMRDAFDEYMEKLVEAGNVFRPD